MLQEESAGGVLDARRVRGRDETEGKTGRGVVDVCAVREVGGRASEVRMGVCGARRRRRGRGPEGGKEGGQRGR